MHAYPGSNAGYLSIVHASVVNKALTSFLAAQPPPRPNKDDYISTCSLADQYPYALSHKEFMKRGLTRLAELKGNESIQKRDPYSSLSFSCATDDIIKNQEEMMAKFVDGQQKAFSPLGADGRPTRK